jgi:RimJ/RimL family protein N-acetyltransferase
LARQQLKAAIQSCAGRDLLDAVHLRRLIARLPARDRPWTVGEENVLFYCTRETFRPYAGVTTEFVRPEDPLWHEARKAEREFAQEGRRWHVEAAFAVYVGSIRASTAKLIDKSHEPFRAVAISTEPAFRRRGYARACVSALTSYALERDLVPLYNTQTINAASVATARAVGYTEYIRYLTVT